MKIVSHVVLEVWAESMEDPWQQDALSMTSWTVLLCSFVWAGSEMLFPIHCKVRIHKAVELLRLLKCAQV